MDKNSINLTEHELKHMISSIIREELQRYVISEMAMSIKDYKYRVESLMQQILENWCLIRYCSITGEKQELKNHWKYELKAHINNIASIKLKNGNSYLSKQNALYALWNAYDWDTDETCISRRLYAKFEKENINTNDIVFAQIVSEFKNETKNIINILLSTSNMEVSNYVNNI